MFVNTFLFIPASIFLVWEFIFGTIIGSFLNVLISRLPREESIIYPPSHCPHCKKNIKWYDNIPIFSYFILLGRCRSCKSPISIRYPIVEALTGILFILINSLLGFRISDFGFWLNAFFVSALIVVIFADFETEIIPDEIIFFGIPLALIFHFFSGNIIASLFGCAMGYSLLFLISLFGKIIFKKEALGYGDVKLAALMGAWLTTDGLFPALFLGYFIGAFLALLLLIFKIKKRGDYIPFGPALSVGALLTLFFGREIINYYLAYFIQP